MTDSTALMEKHITHLEGTNRLRATPLRAQELPTSSGPSPSCPSRLALTLTRSCQIPCYTCRFNKTASQLGLDTLRGSPALNSTAEFVSVAETLIDCLKTNQNNKKSNCWKLHIGQSLPGESNLLTNITHVCPYHKRSLHCKRAAVASPGGPGKTPHAGPAEILSLYLTQCNQHGCYHTSYANKVKHK